MNCKDDMTAPRLKLMCCGAVTLQPYAYDVLYLYWKAFSFNINKFLGNWFINKVSILEYLPQIFLARVKSFPDSGW